MNNTRIQKLIREKNFNKKMKSGIEKDHELKYSNSFTQIYWNSISF